MSSTAMRVIRRKKSSLSEVKIAVVGAPGVGKSALTVRYLTKRYIGEYDHNSENRYKHEAMLDGEPVIFEILDTCPKSCDDFPLPDSIQATDGFLLVYSILDRTSFEYATKIRQYITEQKALRDPGGNGLSIVLLANKADMVHLRQVSAEEGEQLAKDLDCYFAEVSAAEQMQSIADAFAELGRQVHAVRRRSKPPISHSLLDRVLGNRGSASIGIRTYVRGKSDSALPKD